VKIDLLQIKGLGALLKSPWFWRLCRIFLLAILLLMIGYGWHQHAIPGVAAADPLMYTNLATYGLWVLWLMGVVFVALLFGRLWCAFCPLGWLNGIISRSGLKRTLPGWLQNQYPVTLTLIVLQLAVYWLSIHRFPDYSAVLMATAIGLVISSGLLFRQRAFCSLFCPAGAVMALYARIAPFQLRVGQQAVCDSCDSRQCVSEEPSWRRFEWGRGILFWNSLRPGCPIDLHPQQLTDDAGCTLCMQCVDNCAHHNLQLGFRPWLAELGQKGLNRSETLFVVVLLGMLTASFSKVNISLREVLFWLPQQAAVALGWQTPGYALLAAIWVTLILPLLLLLPGLILFKLRHLRESTLPAKTGTTDLENSLPLKPSSDSSWTALGQLLLPFIPLLLTVHLILALVKLNTKGAYLPLVLQDPTGVQSYLAMQITQTVAQPTALLPLEILKWLALAILLFGYLFSLLAARKIANRLLSDRAVQFYFWASVVGVSIPAVLYTDTLIRWLFVR